MTEQPNQPSGLNPDFDLGRHIEAVLAGPDEFENETIAAANRIAARLEDSEYAATHDPLTGLWNRKGFEEKYSEVLTHPHKRSTDLKNEVPEHAFVLIDIDYFKTVNEEHGHPVGDRVLVVLANALRELLRDTDVVGRLGGDELAVLMPNTDQNMALVAIGRFMAFVTKLEAIDVDQKRIRLGVSAGITRAAAGYAATYQRADDAEKDAKHSGKNQIIIYQDQES